jgi:hypothetical protein
VAQRRIKPAAPGHPARAALAAERERVLARCRAEAPAGGWGVDPTGAVVGQLTCAWCHRTGPARFQVRLVAVERAGQRELRIQTRGDWTPPFRAPRCAACSRPAPAVGSAVGGDHHD